MKCAFMLGCLFACAAHAQFFTLLPEASLPARSADWAVPGPRPTHGSIFGVQAQAFAAALAQAPRLRHDVPLGAYGAVIRLPDPTGDLVDCFVAESPVMAAELQRQFPRVRSYVVEAADKGASGRLEMSPRGATAMLRTVNGAKVWMIDPWQSGDPHHAVAYWLSDLPGGDDWVCHATEGLQPLPAHDPPAYEPRALQELRTFRLAMACTGEYGLYHSQIQGHAPNIADPLAAIVTVVSRANVVYEADLAVHFDLVANNDQLIFTDPATDPYATTCDGSGGASCSGAHLSVNINTLDAVIGNDNFDVGHVVTRIAGGVAYLRSVCRDFKAGAVSGIARGGDIDPFSALVVIHELGHQFGANHTFSGSRGRCAGNVNLSTAWEAGSGSSPMAYAGGCPVGDAPPSDNIRLFADPFFHHGSILEMQNFVAGETCQVQTVTANNIPVLPSLAPTYLIPPSTPFALQANATDADSDVLTYSWEQFDAGVARPLSGTGSEDNGVGALFRVFPPVVSQQRTFPQMADILSGIPTPGERLPTATGFDRRFRVIARDNHPGAGGVAISPFVTVTIAQGSSAFRVLSPASGHVYREGPMQVTWMVGNTSAAPISCSLVTIRLSTDNGATFPTVMGTFPNNGAATVQLPRPAATTAVRVRIDAVGKIFFAVSQPFTLEPPCEADINDDGGVDGADVEAFFILWSAGDVRSDLNLDGGVDGGDVQHFFTRWENGC